MALSTLEDFAPDVVFFFYVHKTTYFLKIAAERGKDSQKAAFFTVYPPYQRITSAISPMTHKCSG